MKTRTSTQIKADLEKTNSQINSLKSLSSLQAQQMTALDARKVELESELKDAPDTVAAEKYINSHYKRPDKQ
jgi:hypothetical protein